MGVYEEVSSCGKVDQDPISFDWVKCRKGVWCWKTQNPSWCYKTSLMTHPSCILELDLVVKCPFDQEIKSMYVERVNNQNNDNHSSKISPFLMNNNQIPSDRMDKLFLQVSQYKTLELNKIHYNIHNICIHHMTNNIQLQEFNKKKRKEIIAHFLFLFLNW